jgi:hypothetical protein
MNEASPSLHYQGLAQAALQVIPMPIALLDGSGTIVSVNDAWHAAIRDAPNPVGKPYLSVCADAAGPGQDHHSIIQQGLAQVLAGDRANYVRTYTATDAQEDHLSQLVITLLPTSGAVVVHQALKPSSDSGRWRLKQARERDKRCRDWPNTHQY